MEQYVKGFKGFTPVKMCGLSPLASFYLSHYELGILPKFHSEAFLKTHEYPSADDFESKTRLHGV